MRPSSIILMIDDDPNARTLVASWLAGEDYWLIFAADGGEGLAQAAAHLPDVILLDAVMPGLDGYEVCRRLRADDRLAGVPILMWAIPDDRASRLTGLEAGADDFLSKPFDREELLARLRIITRLRRYRHPLEQPHIFQQFADHTPNGIVLCGEANVVTNWNTAMEQISGVKRADAVGRPLWEILPPAAGDPGQPLPAGETQPGRAIERPFRRPDGDERILEISVFVITGDPGVSLGAIVRDITQGKRAQEALAQERDRMRALMDNIPDAIYFKDRQSRFTYINRALANHLGLNQADEAVGRTDFDYFTPKHAQPAYEAEQRIIQTGEPLIDLEEMETWPDRPPTWVLTTKMPLRDPAGAITGLFGVSRDVTERKLAEAALVNSEKRFRALIENSTDGIELINVEGQILYQSPAAARIMGYTSPARLGRPFGELIHPDDLAAAQALWRQLMLSPKDSVQGQYRLRHRDGGWRSVEFTATNLLNEPGVGAVIVNYRDITERVAHERELAALVTMSSALRVAQNTAEMLPVILDQVQALLQSQAAAFIRPDPANEDLVVELGRGLAAAHTGRRLAPGTGICDAVLASGQPYVTNAQSTDPYGSAPGLWPEELRALVCIPLVAQNESLGVLWLARGEPFSDAEVHVFAAISNLAASALYRSAAHELTERSARQLATAGEVGRQLAETLALPRIYAHLAGAVYALLPGIRSVSISLFDAPLNQLTGVLTFTPDGPSAPAPAPARLDGPGMGSRRRAIQTRQAVVVSHSPEPEGQADRPVPPNRPQAPAGGVLYLPMLAQGQAIGLVEVESSTPGRVPQAEVDVLTLVVNTAAIAVENARLFRATRRQVDELSVVSRLALAAAAGGTFDATIAQATAELDQLWPEAALGFLFVDETGSQLRVHPTYRGLPTLAVAPVPLGSGLIGWAMREQKPVRVGNVLADPRYLNFLPETRSEMVAPLIVAAGGENRLIGAINVESSIREAFSEEDLNLLTTLASQLALLFEKARLDSELAAHAATLEQRVKERTQQLEGLNKELQQAKLEADRANQAKSEFLSRMSHELRTPLNAVLGFAQLIEMENPGPELGDDVRQISRAGRHLLTLIDEVLDIARVETGRLSISLESVSVDAVVLEVLDLVRPLAAKRQIALSAERPAAEWRVHADPQRLKQVLLNLLSNAIKYNREGGAVSVEVSLEQARSPGAPEPSDAPAPPCRGLPRIRFVVRDTGRGIPADRLPRLFTPFDRLGAEQTDVQGTGLGLAFSKNLVEAMNGCIGLESVEGQGTTAWVDLPAAALPAEPFSPEIEPAKPTVRPPEKIRTVISIEDNLQNRTLIEKILARRGGIRLISCTQGQLGIDLAREHHPDLVLLDLHLPDLPGDSVLQALHADEQTRDIPVVIVSADALPSETDRLLAAGARAYLTKPLDVRRFLQVVDDLLDEGVAGPEEKLKPGPERHLGA